MSVFNLSELTIGDLMILEDMIHIIHSDGYPKGFNYEVVTPVIDNTIGGLTLMNSKGQVLRVTRDDQLGIWVTLSDTTRGFLDDLLGAAYSYNLTKPELKELLKALKLAGRETEIEIIESLV